MYTTALLLSIPLVNTTTDYSALKQRIEEKRRSFTASYQVADSAERVTIIDSARTYLFDPITLDILPA